MYIAEHFREDRQDMLERYLADHPFATLVLWTNDALVANQLPLLYEPPNRLVGHLARANPLCVAGATNAPAVAVFTGPQHYVSPSWYASKKATGKVVPTWNYVVVHVHGRVKLVHDREWLRGLVMSLTERMEADRHSPWRVTDAPADYIDGLLDAIVGVELTITRIEGKSKLSQNRTHADSAGVIVGLESEADDDALAMAELMRWQTS